MRPTLFAFACLLGCAQAPPAPRPADAAPPIVVPPESAAPAVPTVPTQVTSCPPGPHSRLEIQALRRPDIMRHDHDVGADRLVLRDLAGRALAHVESADSHFRCLGVSGTRHVVGSMFERGAWFVLGAVSYLPEDAHELAPSAFTRDDYLALASTASPDGRYLAFIGGHGTVEGLFVLDTHSDQVRKLGRAPLPPPDEYGICTDDFGWGSCGGDGYVELEPTVMQFLDEHTLVVRYGADTRKKRATKRTTQRFAL